MLQKQINKYKDSKKINKIKLSLKLAGFSNWITNSVFSSLLHKARNKLKLEINHSVIFRREIFTSQLKKFLWDWMTCVHFTTKELRK